MFAPELKLDRPDIYRHRNLFVIGTSCDEIVKSLKKTRKKRFCEVSKILTLDIDLKITLLDYQNNCVERLSFIDDKAVKVLTF